jgi:NADH dehydrogenase [ubiquinone] 1 alpha subcomplex assembly factor 7
VAHLDVGATRAGRRVIATIAALIEREGPLPLARAMALAAGHYYAHLEPFGVAGDFVTAPEISQMFDELIGLWLVDLWQRAGQPASFRLVELGPGRGTLMADALRAAGKATPGFVAAADLHLVETSPRLRALQARRLPGATWHDRLDTVPAGAPLLLVANEFLDALPLTQFERTPEGWALRRVGPRGWDLAIAANPALIPEAVREAPPGRVHERNFAAESLAAAVAKRLASDGGAALFIDYGYMGPALGDTLQAIHGGAFADPLATLGEADISAHVDFAAIARAAAPHAAVHGPTPQDAFLHALGLAARAEALRRLAADEARAAVSAAEARLAAPGAMGRLFQALALSAPGWPAPAGLPRFAP